MITYSGIPIHLPLYLFIMLPEWYNFIYVYTYGRGARDQISNIRRIIEKAREFQKNLYFCFIDHAKTFDCMDHNKLEKS